MSQENVDAIVEQFAATNDRDFAKAMTYYAEDVVLVVSPNAFLGGGTFTGREAVGKWFGDWFSTFAPGYKIEIEETRDLGDAVFFIATHSGRGRGSGADVRDQMGYLYTFRDGKIIRAEVYRDLAAAREAAGLNE